MEGARTSAPGGSGRGIGVWGYRDSGFKGREGKAEVLGGLGGLRTGGADLGTYGECRERPQRCGSLSSSVPPSAFSSRRH